MDKDSILSRAHDIVHNRSEESDRKYGPFIENMERTAAMASIMSGKELTAEDCYNVFIAQKLVRESYAHKEDNLLDAVAYTSSLNEYRNEKATKQGNRAAKKRKSAKRTKTTNS